MHQWVAAEGCSRYLRMLRLHLQKAGHSSNSKVSLQISQSELEMARELLMPPGNHKMGGMRLCRQQQLSTTVGVSNQHNMTDRANPVLSIDPVHPCISCVL